jgi:hypothetical protein
MNEQHVRQQIALMASQWRELVAPDRYNLMVDRVMGQRGFTDADVTDAVAWTLENIERPPTVAAFLSHMRDRRALRLEAHASQLRRVDHGLPRMILTARTCTREGCDGHPELVADIPEPGSRNRAHARLWCPSCISAQPIERDLVTGTLRYWLDTDELAQVMAEPHELRNHPTQGYHHLVEQLASLRHQLPAVDPSGAAPLREVRAREHRRASDLVGLADILGNAAVEVVAS